MLIINILASGEPFEEEYINYNRGIFLNYSIADDLTQTL